MNSFIEQSETKHKLAEATNIAYSKQMIINDSLSIKSQLLTQFNQYPLNDQKQQQNETDAVIQLEFSKIIKNCIQNQENQQESDVQIINKYCFVVDRSQSMIFENKLQNVKQSLLNLIEKINPNSQYALISFGSSQKIVFDFISVTQENIEQVKRQVNSIVSTGGTNIVKALQVAHNLIVQDQDLQNQSINGKKVLVRYSIILLTDGQDQLKEKAIFAIRENLKNKDISYTINCLGFGIDQDPTLLGAIASYTGGKFCYIRPEESIFPVFENQIKLQEEVIVENVDIEIQQSTKTIYDENKNSYKFQTCIQPYENVFDEKLNRIYFKNIRKGDEKNILLRIKYKYQLKNNDKDISANIINQNSNKNEDILQNISLSSLDQTFVLNNEDVDGQCKLRKQNEVSLIKEETINLEKSDEESQINKKTGTDFILSDLLSDLSSFSQGCSQQEQQNQNNQAEKYFSDNSNEIRLNSNEKLCLNSQITPMQKEKQADHKNQCPPENFKTQQRNQDQQNEVSQNNSRDEIEEESIQFIKSAETINNYQLNFGQININFTYEGNYYIYKIPLIIKFATDIKLKQVENEVCAIQKLRILYLKATKKSQLCLLKEQIDSSISELTNLKILLESKPLYQFDIYQDLLIQVSESISKMNQLKASMNKDQKEISKKNCIISQTVSICTYLNESSTKHCC